MHLVGILCSLGAAVFWAMAVIMFKMSGDVLSPTALNLFKAIITLVLLVPTLWRPSIFMVEKIPNRAQTFEVNGIFGIHLKVFAESHDKIIHRTRAGFA